MLHPPAGSLQQTRGIVQFRTAVTGRDPAKNSEVGGGTGDRRCGPQPGCSQRGVAAVVNKVVERFGNIDILVNNAGLCQWNGRVTDMPRAAQSERRAPHVGHLTVADVQFRTQCGLNGV